MTERNKRRRRKRRRLNLPLSEEAMKDVCEKYPFVKKMLDRFELAVE